MNIGPDVNRAVLLPLLRRFAEQAEAHKAARATPHAMAHMWAYTTDIGKGEFVISVAGHPMVDADRGLVELSRPVMEEIARQTGWTIKLVRFDRVGVSIDTIGG